RIENRIAVAAIFRRQNSTSPPVRKQSADARVPPCRRQPSSHSRPKGSRLREGTLFATPFENRKLCIRDLSISSSNCATVWTISSQVDGLLRTGERNGQPRQNNRTKLGLFPSWLRCWN